MTQDEKWQRNYQIVIDFIETNHINPSRHFIEDHSALNWLKQQRKLMNVGLQKPERIEAFKKLQELIEANKRINQWK